MVYHRSSVMGWLVYIARAVAADRRPCYCAAGERGALATRRGRGSGGCGDDLGRGEDRASVEERSPARARLDAHAARGIPDPSPRATYDARNVQGGMGGPAPHGCGFSEQQPSRDARRTEGDTLLHATPLRGCGPTRRHAAPVAPPVACALSIGRARRGGGGHAPSPATWTWPPVWGVGLVVTATVVPPPPSTPHRRWRVARRPRDAAWGGALASHTDRARRRHRRAGRTRMRPFLVGCSPSGYAPPVGGEGPILQREGGGRVRPGADASRRRGWGFGGGRGVREDAACAWTRHRRPSLCGSCGGGALRHYGRMDDVVTRVLAS